MDVSFEDSPETPAETPFFMMIFGILILEVSLGVSLGVSFETSFETSLGVSFRSSLVTMRILSPFPSFPPFSTFGVCKIGSISATFEECVTPAEPFSVSLFLGISSPTKPFSVSLLSTFSTTPLLSEAAFPAGVNRLRLHSEQMPVDLDVAFPRFLQWNLGGVGEEGVDAVPEGLGNGGVVHAAKVLAKQAVFLGGKAERALRRGGWRWG